MPVSWVERAKRIQAIAQSGLTYSSNEYDIERYEELRSISVAMMSEYSNTPLEKVGRLFASEKGYQTPKVDVRAIIIKDNKILMVKEKLDGCWALPGGWADVGYTAGEVAVKEVKEEAGLDVLPVKLLAVLDKKCHPHPPSPYHIYKLFILCDCIGGQAEAGMETSDVGYFAEESLPELSVERNTESQIRLMFEYVREPHKHCLFD